MIKAAVTKPCALLLISLFVSACGGGSSGNSSQVRQLNYYNGVVGRQTISHYFTTYRYGPTMEFYHFVDRQSVIFVKFPNDTLEFTMSASLHLFTPSASNEAIRLWISNQHSGGSHPQAAAPTTSIDLINGVDFRIDGHEFLAREVGTLGDTYDLYDVIYTIDAYTHPEVRLVESFEAVTTVAQHINRYGNILNTSLPIHEKFEATSTTNFFSAGYMALRTNTPRFAPSLVDPNRAFYYPLCCGQEGGIDETRLSIGNNTLSMRNAQFTIGQTLHRFPNEQFPNPKIGTPHQSIAEISWGELDLSEPYRVSFCIVGNSESPTGRMELWVNNNISDNILDHGIQSRIVGMPTGHLSSGARLSINVPGDIINSNSGGAAPIGTVSSHKGNAKSFLQLRVDNDGHLVIRDLVIERQSENNATGLNCSAVQ